MNGKPYCFLAGAGISSYQYPTAYQIVNMLLDVIIGEKNRTELGKDPENTVRFEFLLQTIKEYIDPQLSFISRIFQLRGKKTHLYHQLLAIIALYEEHVVFTTNFDKLIEGALLDLPENLNVPRKKLIPAYRRSHFENQLQNFKKYELIKLHGSTDDPKTLAATYEGIRPRDKADFDPHCKLLNKEISRRNLCVLGYGGWDDADIVPVLINTKAEQFCINWFFHHNSNENNKYRFDEIFDIESGEIKKPGLNYLADKPVTIIFREAVRKGNRKPENLFIHIGKTEAQFSEFIKGILDEGVVQSVTKQPDFADAQTKDDIQYNAREIIQSWMTSLPDYKSFIKLCSGMDIAHQIGSMNVMDALSRKLDVDIHCCPVRSLLAHSKMIINRYWVEDFEGVKECFDAGKRAFSEFWKNKELLKIRDCVDPALLLLALMELHRWNAETERFQGHFENTQKLVSETINILPSHYLSKKDPKNKMESKRGNRWRAFYIVRTNSICIKADNYFGVGRFDKARKIYEKARSSFESAGNRFWNLYARIGLADCTLYSGKLTEAEALYDEILDLNVLSGKTSWMDCHPWIHKIDISRVRGDFNKRANYSEKLKYLLKYKEDSSIIDLADVLEWYFSWFNKNNINLGEIKKRYKEIADLEWDDIGLYGLELLYLDFLIKTDGFLEAKELSQKLVVKAREQKVPYLEISADVYRAQIKLTENKIPNFTRLFKKCDKYKLTLHRLYVTALSFQAGIASMDEIRESYTRKDGACELHGAFRNGIQKNLQSSILHIRFPFFYS